MSPYDLTTLAAVKAWLGLPAAAGPNDGTLSTLITAASRTICAALGRPGLLPQSYTETLDLDTRRVYLKHWPALQVNSVLWRGIAIPPDAKSGPRRFDGLRPTARRPRPSRPPAGD